MEHESMAPPADRQADQPVDPRPDRRADLRLPLRRRLIGAVLSLSWVAACLALLPPFNTVQAQTKSKGSTGMTAYDFAFTGIDGKPLPMTQFRGKVVLLVNTASQCGFTPQYADLETVYQTYRNKGLVVLGVPSNDFGGQEPGTAAQIKDFCEVNFNIDFPMTDKQAVIGPQAHPLYQWIGRELGEAALPKWNFHKYLIGADGALIEVFPTPVKPTDPKVTAAIEAALKKAKS
jgi:glutathione peroxidase